MLGLATHEKKVLVFREGTITANPSFAGTFSYQWKRNKRRPKKRKQVYISISIFPPLDKYTS